MPSRRWIAVIPVLVSLLLVLAVYGLQLQGNLANKSLVYDPPVLLAVLNGIFVTAIPLIVAYFAGRGFLDSGVKNLLLLGGGILVFGCTGIATGLRYPLFADPNEAVTIYNTGSLVSSIMQTASVVLAAFGVAPQAVSGRRLHLAVVYAGSFVVSLAIIGLAVVGAFPVFFVQGVGSTVTRQLVLGTTIALFAFSALLAMKSYLGSHVDLLFWYSLGLVLIATGLLGVALAITVGGPLSWTGRISQFLGGLYLLAAVVASGKKD